MDILTMENLVKCI